MDSNSITEPIFRYPDWITLIVAIVAAAIGGAMTLIGVIFNHRLDLRKQRKAEQQSLQNLYRSILAEIQTLWDMYHEGVGQALESLEGGKPLKARIGPTGDYFSVYKNNSIMIGRIPDSELLHVLIRSYIGIQGLIDDFKLHDDLIEEYKKWKHMAEDSGVLIYKRRANEEYKRIVNFSGIIKRRHNTVSEDINHLIDLLKSNIKLD